MTLRLVSIIPNLEKHRVVNLKVAADLRELLGLLCSAHSFIEDFSGSKRYAEGLKGLQEAGWASGRDLAHHVERLFQANDVPLNI